MMRNRSSSAEWSGSAAVDLALVGFTRSYNDLQWLEMVRVWAAAHEPAMAEAWVGGSFERRGRTTEPHEGDLLP